MDKSQFNLLVKNYSSLEREDATLLVSLLKDYPYSQLIHHLSARVFQDVNLEGKENLLHASAVYATDRGVLKSIMTAPRSTAVLNQENVSLVEEADLPPTSIHGKVEVTSSEESIVQRTEPVVLRTESDSDGDIYEQVVRDIDEMHQAKKRFEEMVLKLENRAFTPPLEAGQEEELIEEIKQHAKKRIKADAKLKEQIEIIDRFIKTQPAMPKAKASVANAVDLTEKSASFGENIVSETLVELLLKQGKKEKAVEMLKKLIWKFPQKKAYFAARIQELKK